MDVAGRNCWRQWSNTSHPGARSCSTSASPEGRTPRRRCGRAFVVSAPRRQHRFERLPTILAALLFEDQGWITRRSGSRAQLTPEHNSAASEWQRDRLRLIWVARPRPWLVEASVITLMQPPLDLAGNASHPMGRRLKRLRANLREVPSNDSLHRDTAVCARSERDARRNRERAAVVE